MAKRIKIEGEINTAEGPVHLHPYLIRVVEGFNGRNGNLGDLTSLKASILKEGVNNALLVRRNRDEEAGTWYDLIDGERRLTAIRELHEEGYTDVRTPIKRLHIPASEAEVKMATANMERKDFDPIEEAGIVARFVNYGWTDTEIAHKLNRSVKWVQQRKQLHMSSKPVKDAVKDGIPQDVASDLATNVPEKSQGQVLAESLAEVDGDFKKLRGVVARKTGRKIRPGKKVVREIISVIEGNFIEEDTFTRADIVAALRYASGDITEAELYKKLAI
jgi:ParB/RepB/Spo0J family partition protein